MSRLRVWFVLGWMVGIVPTFGADVPAPLEKGRELLGLRVHSENGTDLGVVKDLLVDLPAGRVAYVIVSSEKNDYRALAPSRFYREKPNELLFKGDPNHAGELLSLSAQEWENLSNPAQSQRLYHYYGTEPIPTNGPFTYRAGGDQPPTLARGRVDMIGYGTLSKLSELLGMKLTNYKSETLGDLKELVVNLGQGEIAYTVINARQKHATSKPTALPPQLFQRHTTGKSLVVNVEPKQMASAPALDPKKWPAVGNPAWGGPAGSETETVIHDQKEPVRSKDLALESQVKLALRKDTSLSSEARDIQVTAQNGMVTLKGKVANAAELQKAMKHAQSVVGEDRVRSELESRKL